MSDFSSQEEAIVEDPEVEEGGVSLVERKIPHRQGFGQGVETTAPCCMLDTGRELYNE